MKKYVFNDKIWENSDIWKFALSTSGEGGGGVQTHFGH